MEDTPPFLFASLQGSAQKSLKRRSTAALSALNSGPYPQGASGRTLAGKQLQMETENGSPATLLFFLPAVTGGFSGG